MERRPIVNRLPLLFVWLPVCPFVFLLVLPVCFTLYLQSVRVTSYTLQD